MQVPGTVSENMQAWPLFEADFDGEYSGLMIYFFSVIEKWDPGPIPAMYCFCYSKPR